MPSMPRVSAKVTKIAYAILGKPGAAQKVRKKRPKKQLVDEKLPT